MGLPGSGKTTLAQNLYTHLHCAWYNADLIRKWSNDWDFTSDGRNRQSYRMKLLADLESQYNRTVVCDFVCPTENTRTIFNADYTIWMDTIQSGRFKDTNKLFETPTQYDVRITKWIDLNLLSKCLEDGNPGTKVTQNYLNELFNKLDK